VRGVFIDDVGGVGATEHDPQQLGDAGVLGAPFAEPESLDAVADLACSTTGVNGRSSTQLRPACTDLGGTEDSAPPAGSGVGGPGRQRCFGARSHPAGGSR